MSEAKRREGVNAREFWIRFGYGKSPDTIFMANETRRIEGIHVIEYAAHAAALAKIADLEYELNSKQRPLGEQVLALTTERDELKKKYALYDLEIRSRRER
jgi:hypothetical protein